MRLRGLRSPESTQQRIDDDASAQQLGEGGQRCRLSVSVLSVRRAVQIGPRGRNQGARAVRQHEYEMQATAAMCLPQHFQRLALEGMAPADDGHPWRVAVARVVMGSVWCLPSTGSTTTC